MQFALHKLSLHLQSNDTPIQAGWQQIFAGWPESVSEPDITLQLSLVDELPPLPPQEPFFTDEQNQPYNARILSVYDGGNDQVLLHFLDGALLNVPLTREKNCIKGTITKRGLGNGRLEDVIFTGIAPFLRRHGYFLVHAFAASHEGQGVLISGASHSGKTTTGLNLLLAGWQLLANDVVLLEKRTDGVYALPLPGIVGIRPPSLTILPDLIDLIGKTPLQNNMYELTSEQASNGRYAPPVPIKAIYFPHIEDRPDNALQPLSRAICLARLMAESVDQWDSNMLIPHMELLQDLSQQAKPFTLHLGRDVTQIPRLLIPD